MGVEPKIVHVSSDVIKEVWPAIYDEIYYHKNTTQIFDDTKIKSITGIEPTIGLAEGMKKIISSMKDEVEERNLKLDNKWNDYCDTTIYYAYKKGQLSQSDKQIVRDYINNVGQLVFNLSCIRVKIYSIKDVLYRTKVRLERKLKKNGALKIWINIYSI